MIAHTFPIFLTVFAYRSDYHSFSRKFLPMTGPFVKPIFYSFYFQLTAWLLK
ncbi:hypothetical protein CU007_0223 [Enterococcus faecium]|nr:hypothetical protein [Enterococcus faecium]MBK4871179.1 hypothetical protein [Enterococcus faecium]MBK4881946.1 hypothetical protein [Enterococcus faecium]